MLRRLEERFVGPLTAHERTVLRHGALWFFLLFAGYYILRPIREQVGATYGNLGSLFLATFIAMLVAIPAYSWLVARIDRRKLVPAVYAFFVFSLCGFWAAMKFTSTEATIGNTQALEFVARAFFVWVSIYGLFIVSMFWSVMGDFVSTEQGRRLFGFVFGGGTAGGLVASPFVDASIRSIGEVNILLVPAGLMIAAVCVFLSLERRASAPARSAARGKATGGNPFAGFRSVFQSRYLFATMLYTALLATCGTTIYSQQAEIVKLEFADEIGRTQYFARVNFCVQILTLICQTAIVGRLMKSLGLGLTLAILPMAYIAGMSALALAPGIIVLAIITVTGRSAEYAIMNPAREVLFTALKREDRYKAKSFIDTVVRRGGDTLVANAYRFLRESMGFALTTMSWCVMPFAILWVGIGIYLGNENQRAAVQANGDESGE